MFRVLVPVLFAALIGQANDLRQRVSSDVAQHQKAIVDELMALAGHSERSGGPAEHQAQRGAPAADAGRA